MNILTLDNLRAAVPAAFAEEPADNVSHRYSFIRTDKIITEVMDRGWVPVEARQSQRIRDQRHCTHMIKFMRPDATVRIGDVAPQIMVVNNHAAAKTFWMPAGFIKWACSNGLIVSMGIAESKTRRIHIDGAAVDVDKALTHALSMLDEAMADIKRWQNIHLNFVQQQQLAAGGILVRNNDDPYWSRHFDAHEFLTRRRPEDQGDDLWTVFNVLQENIIRGGVQGAVRETKPITQVGEVVRINQGLWQLAKQYGQTHGVN